MSRYAEITDNEVTNVLLCDDEAFAAEMGWVGPLDALDPQPGTGWAYDAANQSWTAPVVVTPPPTPQQTATTQLQQMAATDIPTFTSQLQTDISTVTNTGWAPLTAAEQQAMMLRILNGFGSVMQAIQTHAVATGTLPPPPA